MWPHCEVLFCPGEQLQAFPIGLSTLCSTGFVLHPLIDCRLPFWPQPWTLTTLSLWLPPALTLCMYMFMYVRRLPRSWNCLTILILSVPLYCSCSVLYCEWIFSCLINKLQMDPSASSESLQTERRRIVEKSRYFYFLCVQKVLSSHHKIHIETLMMDGLSWRCFSYFSGPRQCYLQQDSHKPPVFHLKYLKLCSERSFYGFGTTWG